MLSIRFTFYLIYLSRVPIKSIQHFLEKITVYAIFSALHSTMIFRKGIKRFTHFLHPVATCPFFLAKSLPRRTERDRGDFSKRIHFKVCGFMQEATVGAKDFSICRIRGRQHVHHRYRAEIE